MNFPPRWETAGAGGTQGSEGGEGWVVGWGCCDVWWPNAGCVLIFPISVAVSVLFAPV